MSRQLLIDLNGKKNGLLKKFLNTFDGEPRIAWYPSAGKDYKALLYLHPKYAKLYPIPISEPNAPDLFLYTDYFPWRDSTFLDSTTLYSDDRTLVQVENIEELPKLNLKLHDEIVIDTSSPIENRIVFMNIRITSNQLGSFTYPVIYAFVENEEFYCKKLIPNKAVITHLIRQRYGGGCGGGGYASGVWLLNVLSRLKCEIFLNAGHFNWQSGDLKALEFCSSIPNKNLSKLTQIRSIPSASWSGYGDVSWNLVTPQSD